MKQKEISAVLLVLVFLSFFPAASASASEPFQTSPWTDKEPYTEKISHKLGFGLTNITTGWLAVFFEPCREKNILKGAGKGLWRAVTNTAGGILHTATFPIPVDIPLPGGGMTYSCES